MVKYSLKHMATFDLLGKIFVTEIIQIYFCFLKLAQS